MGKEGKERVNPEIDELVADDFRTAVKVFNNGKLKGRLSPAFEHAAIVYMVSAYARNPGRLNTLGNYVDEGDVPTDLDDHRERMAEYADSLAEDFQQIAHHLSRDSPGEKIELEKLLDAGLDSERISKRPDHYPDDFHSLIYD